MILFDPNKDIGRKVAYRPSPASQEVLKGTIVREGRRSKMPCVLVHYDGEEEPRIAYCDKLEYLEE